MKNNLYKKTMAMISRWMLVSGLVLLCSMNLQAQITVAVDVPTNTTPNLLASYPTLAAALTDLNAVTAMSGPIVLTLTGAETAPASGFVIGSASLNPALSSSTSVTFNGPATINAGIGVATPGTAGSDGMLRLSGADWITINGLTLTDGNTTNPATMEFGIALFKPSVTDGCQNNTIKNCVINMQRSNFAAGSGPIVDGAVGIALYNSSYASSTTALVPTAATGSNSFNKIYSNTINGGNYGVVMIGYADATPFANADQGNDIGGASALTGNNILNYGGGTGVAVASAGVRTLAQYGLNVSYNTVNNNNGSGVNHPSTIRGIYTNTATSASETITYNNVTVNGGGTTSQLSAIENVAGSTAAANTITISNNTINTTYPTATTGISYGIYNNGASPANLNVNSNTINITSAATSGSDYAIYNSGAVATSNNINSNTVSFTLSAASTSATVRGVYDTGGAATCSTSISTNTFQNYNYSGATGGTGETDAIYHSAAVLNLTMDNNNFNNLSIKTTGSIYLMNNNYSAPANGSKTITNNHVTTAFARTAAGSSSTYFYYDFGSSPNTVTHTITGNTFSNVTINSSNTGSLYCLYSADYGTGGPMNYANNTVSNITTGAISTLYGIYLMGATGTAGSPNIWTNNNISNVTTAATSSIYALGMGSSSVYINAYGNSATNFTLSGAATFYGHYITGGSGQINVYQDNVTGITNSAAGTIYGAYISGPTKDSIYLNTINTLSSAGSVYGIYVSSGTTNYISQHDLYSLSSSGASSTVAGIQLTSGTSYVFNNKIHGLSTSGGTSPTTSGIIVSAGTAQNVYSNSICDISSSGTATPTVTGITASGGTTDVIYNNLIGDLRAPSANAANAVIGLNVSATSGTINAYYNTVRITGSGSATLFGSSAVSANTGSTLTLINNIFVNNCTFTGTGICVAYRRSSATLTTYGSASNNNLFTGGNFMFSDGTNLYTNAQISNYKTLVTPRDAASFTATPPLPFLSITCGNAQFLHVDPSVATQIESGGSPVAGITTDYDGDTRSGSSPDIGADEFTGTPATPQVQTPVASPAGTQCTAIARTISVSITPVAALTSVTLSYAFNGTAQSPIAMSSTDPNPTTSTATWTATLPAATPGNAVVTFFVTASDGTLSTIKDGASYKDQPNDGLGIAVTANPNPVCSGRQTVLTAQGPQTLPAGYAASNATTTADEEILNVTFGTINNTSTCATLAPGPGSVLNQYSNYTTSVAAANVVPGTSVPFSIQIGTCGGSFTNHFAVFIDWNRNGTFDIATETAYTDVAVTGPHTISGNISVPSNASFGVTLLRVVEVETSGTVSPTGTYSWGETEDYIINITPPLTTYSWSDGVGVISTTSTATASPVNTTTYTLNGTANGCPINPVSLVVIALPVPSAPSITSNPANCGTQTPGVVISPAGAGTIAWYNASNVLIGSQTGTTLTNYPVSATTTLYVSESSGGCESDKTPVVITVNQPDAVHASASTPACANSAITLSVTKDPGSNSYTYSWNGSPASGSGLAGPTAGTPANLVVTPTAAGTYTYTVTATDGPNNCVAVDRVVVTVSDYAYINSVTANPTSVCSGDLVTLTENSTNIIGGPQTTPTGYCTPGTASCTGGDHILNVTFGSINNSSGVCLGSGGNTAYSDFTGTVAAATVNTGSTYPITINVANGGTEHAAAWIDWNRNGVFDASEFVDLNTGTTTGPGGTWIMTTNLTIPVNASPGVTTMRVRSRYSTAIANTDVCTAFSFGETEDYLLNVQFFLPQNPNYTYSWSAGTPGNPANIATDHPTNNSAIPSTASYTVTVSNNGCTSTGSVNVTVNPLPPTPVTASAGPQCGSGPAVNAYVDNGGPGMYHWYVNNVLIPETGSQVLTYSISTTTTFYVASWNGTCESPRAPLVQEVTPSNAITASYTGTTCPGSQITLNVGGFAPYSGGTFDWTANPVSGSGLSGITSGDGTDGHLALTPTAAGTYTYTVNALDANLVCGTSATVEVTIQAPPPLDSVRAVPTAVCSGSSVGLTAYSHIISSGPQTEPAGPYSISNATSTSDDEIFNVTITGTSLNNTSDCSTIAAGPGSAQEMYGNYTTSVAAPTLTAGNTYTGSVTIGQCLVTAYTTGYAIFIDLNRNGLFTDPGERVYGEAATTSAVAGTVKPFTFVLPATATAGVTRMRVVAVEGGDGTTLSPDVTYTWGETEDYDVNILSTVATNPSLTYSWSPVGGNAYNATVNPLNLTNNTITTTYTVTVSNGTCATSGSVVVTVNPVLPAPVGSDNQQCGTAVPNCSVTGTNGGPFRWYDAASGGNLLETTLGSTLVNYAISSTTTFYVAEFDGTCESPRTAVVQTVTPAPAASIASLGVQCKNSAFTLDASGSDVSYTSFSWSANPQSGSGLVNSNSSMISVTPTAAGTYTYTVSASGGGCSNVASVVVTVNELPALASVIANPTTVCSNSTVTLTASSPAIGTGPTTLPATYCVPVQSGSSCVSHVDITGTTVNSNPAACVTPYYNINDPLIAGNTGTLTAGQTYTINLTTTGTSIISVWIDYNRNGTYDASEWVQPWTSAAAGSATFTVPANCAAGATGMRIRSRLNGNTNGAGDGCSVFGSGSTEDYTITLLGIQPYNPALTYTWSPAGGSGVGLYSTTVNPVNNTPSLITTTYYVTINDGSCSNSGSVTVDVNPLPANPGVVNGSQCGSGIPDASIVGNLGGPYRWYTAQTGNTAIAGETGSVLSNNIANTINATTTYWVTEFDGTCESARVPVVQEVIPGDPIQAAAQTAPFCTNSVINLTQTLIPNGPLGSVYTSWNWFAVPLSGSGLAGVTAGDAGDGHLDVTPTVAGTYTYIVQGTTADGTCHGLGSIEVTVGTIPPIQVTANPTQVCPGESATLSATSLVIGNGPQTEPVGPYSNSNATSTSDDEIFNVTITGTSLNNTSTCGVAAPGPGSLASEYGNYTTSVPAPTLTAGSTYSGSVTIGQCLTTAYTTGYAIFIDLNRNGLFTDLGERVYGEAATTSAVAGTVKPFTFVLPSNATPGVTRMRVVAVEGGNGTTFAPNVTYSWGETEDYDVNIQAAVQVPNVTYSWNPGGAGNSIVVTPASSTTYIVTATESPSGCSASASLPVNVINLTVQPIAAAAPAELCFSGNSNLSVSNEQVGVTYSWETSSSPTGPWTAMAGTGTANTGTINATTYYHVIGTCGAASLTSDPLAVVVNSPGVTSGTGGTRCGAGYVTASVTGTGNFDWYDASTGGNLLFTNQSSVNYLLTTPSQTLWVQAYTGASPGTCLATGRFAVVVTSTAAPSVSITAPATTCDNQPISLVASSTNDPNYTYGWSTDGGNTIAFTGSPYNVNPTSTTTYSVVATDNSGGANNGCGAFASTVVLVYASPAVPIVTPSNPVVCSVGGCTDLTVSNVAGIQPTTNSITIPLFNPSTDETTACPGANLISTFTLPPIPGTVTSAKITINGITLNTGSYGSEVRLNFSGSGIIGTSACFQGATSATTPNPFNYVTGTNVPADLATLGGLLNPAGGTVNILYNEGFNDVTGGPDAVFPASATFEYTFQGPPTYTWNPGNLTGSTVTVCPAANTTYTVVASYTTGCSSSSSIGVAYSPIPDPTSGTFTVCTGNSITLDAGAGFTNYSWNTGETTQTITVSPASTTTYTVTVDNGASCTKTATQIVNVYTPIAPVISPASANICAGDNVTLDAGAGYDTYSWTNNGGNTQTISVSPASTTTYTVTGTVNGCPATSDPVVVNVNPLPPTAAITPAGPINLCSDGSNSPLTLTADITGAGGGASIVWNQDGNPSTSTISVSAGDPDLFLNGGTFGYNFTVTANGCSKTSNTVTVHEIACGGPSLYAKIFIEGYYSANGLMDNGGQGFGAKYASYQKLIDANLASPPNPYDPNVSDNITISLFDPAGSAPIYLNTPVESQTGELMIDGSLHVTFSNAVSSGVAYWIRVTHRNALETWSAAPVIVSATTALAPYDFTSSQSQTYGGNAAELLDINTGSPDGNWGMFSGDISDAGTAAVGVQDGVIESQDYGDMETAVYFILIGYQTEDITGDGVVESADYGLMENNVYFIRTVSGYRP